MIISLSPLFSVSEVQADTVVYSNDFANSDGLTIVNTGAQTGEGWAVSGGRLGGTMRTSSGSPTIRQAVHFDALSGAGLTEYTISFSFSLSAWTGVIEHYVCLWLDDAYTPLSIGYQSGYIIGLDGGVGGKTYSVLAGAVYNGQYSVRKNGASWEETLTVFLDGIQVFTQSITLPASDYDLTLKKLSWGVLQNWRGTSTISVSLYHLDVRSSSGWVSADTVSSGVYLYAPSWMAEETISAAVKIYLSEWKIAETVSAAAAVSVLSWIAAESVTAVSNLVRFADIPEWGTAGAISMYMLLPITVLPVYLGYRIKKRNISAAHALVVIGLLILSLLVWVSMLGVTVNIV